MAVRLAHENLRSLGELRFQPTPKRIRAAVGDRQLVDSSRAVLVWEPDRVVPSYAVPADDVESDLVAVDPASPPDHDPYVHLPDGLRILPPGSFGLHTTEGQPLTLRWNGGAREGAAFRFADRELDGLVALDFTAFDEWLEEDERVFGHPRDPFKRIDVRRSLRHVVIESDGVVLAESSRPRLLFETFLPVRCYLPPDDVRLDLLEHSVTRSVCAYKGEATYWSLEDEGGAVDVAWSYPRPLSDAIEVGGMVCFLDERVDVTVDGERRERPLSPWS